MNKTLLEKTLDGCISKLGVQLDEMKKVFPRYPHAASGGSWSTSGDEEWEKVVNGYWTGGFWVGLLWLAHRLTGDEEFLDWGQRWMKSLAPRAEATGLHDLGFIFFPSAVLGCELTGDDELADLALKAAAGVFSCYSSPYRCLTIFRREPMNRIIAIDTMMNLPLLWWAARTSGNEVYERAARNHAETTLEFLVRNDGSTSHVGHFMTDERDIPKLESWQGRAPDSCWARGQAWAISGWAHAYLFTGDPAYKKELDKALAYYGAHLREDSLPLWDLDVVDDAKYEWDKHELDSSAHAIVACALLTLGDDEYRETAVTWLEVLANKCVVPDGEPGLLAHVCFHRPAGIDVDCSCVFADFYFLFALGIATGRLESPFCLSGNQKTV